MSPKSAILGLRRPRVGNDRSCDGHPRQAVPTPGPVSPMLAGPLDLRVGSGVLAVLEVPVLVGVVVLVGAAAVGRGCHPTRAQPLFELWTADKPTRSGSDRLKAALEGARQSRISAKDSFMCSSGLPCRAAPPPPPLLPRLTLTARRRAGTTRMRLAAGTASVSRHPGHHALPMQNCVCKHVNTLSQGDGGGEGSARCDGLGGSDSSNDKQGEAEG
ncbi:unnamed protein product [Gadus morhua 'NCC']